MQMLYNLPDLYKLLSICKNITALILIVAIGPFHSRKVGYVMLRVGALPVLVCRFPCDICLSQPFRCCGSCDKSKHTLFSALL